MERDLQELIENSDNENDSQYANDQESHAVEEVETVLSDSEERIPLSQA